MTNLAKLTNFTWSFFQSSLVLFFSQLGPFFTVCFLPLRSVDYLSAILFIFVSQLGITFLSHIPNSDSQHT